MDEHGVTRSDRLRRYTIPTAVDAPEMVTLLVERGGDGAPFGAEALGAIAMSGPAAAAAQAIEDATGVVLDALPMSPECVLDALPSGNSGP